MEANFLFYLKIPLYIFLLQHLDGKHVVFGKLTKGMEVLDELENANEKGSKPNPQIKIVDCGEIKA